MIGILEVDPTVDLQPYLAHLRQSGEPTIVLGPQLHTRQLRGRSNLIGVAFAVNELPFGARHHHRCESALRRQKRIHFAAELKALESLLDRLRIEHRLLIGVHFRDLGRAQTRERRRGGVGGSGQLVSTILPPSLPFQVSKSFSVRRGATTIPANSGPLVAGVHAIGIECSSTGRGATIRTWADSMHQPRPKSKLLVQSERIDRWRRQCRCQRT